MSISFALSVDESTGTEAQFIDNSTGVNFSLVLATRFYWGNYYDFINPTSLVEGDDLEQYREYRKTNEGSCTIDNKIITVGERFIPYTTGLTVPSGATFSTTGRWCKYVAPADYLPTSSYNIFTRTPQDLGYAATVTTFPDMLWFLQYETYGVTTPDPIVNLVKGSTYIVAGTTGTCVYDSQTFRIGEQIVAADNGAVSFTGDATLRVKIDAKFSYVNFLYDIDTSLCSIIMSLLADCKCADELQYQVNTVRMKIESLDLSNVQNRTNAALAYQTIQDIQNEIAIIQTKL